MEDHEAETGPRGSGDGDQRAEPVRSRWTPKPEQILILESIFNSGMVNPPKDETVRIRKLLEKFGSVGDANVFYWFQNRRSRSRRRQRQIQASLGAAGDVQPQPRAIHNGNSIAGAYYNPAALCSYPISNGPGSSSSIGLDSANAGGLFSFPGQQGGLQELQHGSGFGLQDSPNLHYQSGVITVFINGVATEVGRGPVDMKAMFGGDYLLIHSSGVAVEANEHGFLLQHGESYFLVPRHS
ncbi:WUSCHEL-related homeobox 11-like [Salvia miltiorrhiza]|uniref:WUSCHEL-related homeobox 11-like n=1 Tax=Salvia miltiorrhiza TaxID=226208 RepID=UPI0025AD38DF|nr:WUSCHEL-related homeobox 11-like [Salvia miltiorrhiza]